MDTSTLRCCVCALMQGLGCPCWSAAATAATAAKQRRGSLGPRAPRAFVLGAHSPLQSRRTHSNTASPRLTCPGVIA
eukprot:5862381-Prymnesium_polylepis.1